MDDQFIVDTPEHVAFGYEIAGIGSRFLAALVDTREFVWNRKELMRACLASAVCLILVNVYLTACGSTQIPSSPEAGKTALPLPIVESSTFIPAQTPEALDTIPLYPGVQPVSVPSMSPSGLILLEFRTSISYTNILAFYRETLPQQGWTLDREYSEDNNYWQDFNSIDSTGIRRVFRLTLEVLTNGDTIGYVQIKRWPDPEKIPMQADAQHKNTCYEADPTHSFSEQVTTYNTQATPHEVMAFYETSMPRYGWQFLGSKTFPELLLGFSYEGVNERRMISYSVLVIVRPNSDGPTNVEMRVKGTHIPDATPGK